VYSAGTDVLRTNAPNSIQSTPRCIFLAIFRVMTLFARHAILKAAKWKNYVVAIEKQSTYKAQINKLTTLTIQSWQQVGVVITSNF